MFFLTSHHQNNIYWILSFPLFGINITDEKYRRRRTKVHDMWKTKWWIFPSGQVLSIRGRFSYFFHFTPNFQSKPIYGDFFPKHNLAVRNLGEPISIYIPGFHSLWPFQGRWIFTYIHMQCFRTICVQLDSLDKFSLWSIIAEDQLITRCLFV